MRFITSVSDKVRSMIGCRRNGRSDRINYIMAVMLDVPGAIKKSAA
jgi:hypothetical protein